MSRSLSNLKSVYIIDKSKEKLGKVAAQLSSHFKLFDEHKVEVITGEITRFTADMMVCQINDRFEPVGKASQSIHQLGDAAFRKSVQEQKQAHVWTDVFCVDAGPNFPNTKYVLFVPYGGDKAEVLDWARKNGSSTITLPLLGASDGKWYFLCFFLLEILI